jgi:hypothetical protein
MTKNSKIMNKILETECFEEKYLGLPVPEGRLTKGKFKTTKEIFSKHASDWSEKYMSSGAKIILIFFTIGF